MKYIQLTQNKKTIVSDEDYNFLNQWRWSYHRGYVVRSEYVKDKRTPKFIYMHRLINNTLEGMDTDHINRNKLDNRRENLRSATSSENKMNTGMWKHNTSKHKGVFWDKARRKWMAGIGYNHKFINLGRFLVLNDAIKARKKAERSMGWIK